MKARRPNPKALTNADRIASISEKLRRQLISENAKGKGVGMKTLAQRYGIPERTVRVIIHDSRDNHSTFTAPRPNPRTIDVEWERVIHPGWQAHGELTPAQARMYPNPDAPL